MAKQLGMTRTATLEDGTTVALELGQHPNKGKPKVVDVGGRLGHPPVYRSGVLKYTLTVTDDRGNTVTWQSMNQDYPTAEGYPTLISVEKR